MSILSYKDHARVSSAHLTVFSLSILLIASCTPQEPLSGTSISTGQPQHTTTSSVDPMLDGGSIQVSPKDNMTMAFIPAGGFEMGGENDDATSFPVHTVYLDAFWLINISFALARFIPFNFRPIKE